MSAMTEWNAFDDEVKIKPSARSPLAYVLIFISALFIGILIFCYVVTKRSNPVFLDEHGKPAVQNSGHSHQ